MIVITGFYANLTRSVKLNGGQGRLYKSYLRQLVFCRMTGEATNRTSVPLAIVWFYSPGQVGLKIQ